MKPEKLIRDRSLLWSLAQQAWCNGAVKVTTNGCFDLIHPGHIDFLKQAAGFGDMLFVGLNSDASVRRLKGEGRPILTESARADVLSEFSFVTYIYVFDEPEPSDFILAVRPMFHVKGEDYLGRAIAEKDAVDSCGGKLRFVELSDAGSNSTTKLVERIRQGHVERAE